jgi:hypothetical protein
MGMGFQEFAEKINLMFTPKVPRITPDHVLALDTHGRRAWEQLDNGRSIHCCRIASLVGGYSFLSINVFGAKLEKLESCIAADVFEAFCVIEELREKWSLP